MFLIHVNQIRWCVIGKMLASPRLSQNKSGSASYSSLALSWLETEGQDWVLYFPVLLRIDTHSCKSKHFCLQEGQKLRRGNGWPVVTISRASFHSVRCYVNVSMSRFLKETARWSWGMGSQRHGQCLGVSGPSSIEMAIIQMAALLTCLTSGKVKLMSEY